MSEISERYRRVSEAMTRRVEAVPDDAWHDPSPCAGWDARDVVRHMVGWMPELLAAGAGVQLPACPSVDDDPVAAWTCLTSGIQGLLDDPQIAAARFSHPQAGDHSVEDAIAMFILGDVLIHTWDVARATGGDERLDVDEVHRMLSGVEPYDEMLRASGQYGPRVTVPEDADEQSRLIAFMGRQP
jgi:uncharacterized protein (TIGR03086 family)